MIVQVQPQRIAKFMTVYEDLYQRIRKVPYLGNPVKDYQAAIVLTAAFDDATLEKIAAWGLADPDKFLQEGTLTLTKLKSRASSIAEELKRRGLA